MTNQGNTPIYYLPLEQTLYQKCLIHIIIELHKPHLLKYLQDHQNLEFNDSKQGKETDSMSDESMIDALIFNIKQITNHPTLLVDHYIPRNLLLLNSKENIISLSNKYHKVSEILDKLVERDAKKTIIISVSNAKEMDLVESFLLGKRGLQYYRFSGSSLYYDNHGSFDFHKKANADDSATNGFADIPTGCYSSASTTPPSESIKRRKPGRAKKLPSVGKEKKKSGRPSNNEKKLKENMDTDSGTIYNKRDKEEYTPRLSKNNEKFIEMIQEKKNKKLNVYLILSSQLKYLVQFEDLKSDLILALDSHSTNFDDLSAVLDHQVPIIKPLIVESLEHYESELKLNSGVIYDDSLTLRNQGKRNEKAVKSEKTESERKFEFNRLLAFLSVAAWPDVKVNLPSNISPVSNDIIDWLINPNELKFPYPQTIETKLPHVLDKSLVEKVINTLKTSQDADILETSRIDRYQFYNSKLDIKKEIKVDHQDKRVKTSPKNEDVPNTFNYSQYQLFLTKLINNSFIEMQEWISATQSKLEFVHLDETERQFVIDKGNADCGDLFKKERDLGVALEGRGKMRDKLTNELSKLKDVKDGLVQRIENFKSMKADNFDRSKQEEEIEQLRKKLDELEAKAVATEEETTKIRKSYQKQTSTAAELSAYVKNLEETTKSLENESKGIFRKIQLQGIKDDQVFIERQIKEYSNNRNMWSGFLETIQGELEKRSSTVSTNGSRIPRGSRNNTPY